VEVELTLDGLAGEAPAGIGVPESGPIASGNQVDAGIGDISPSVPVTVCGNSVGVLGDASASCGASDGATTPGSGSGVDLDTILDTSTDGTTDPGAGTQRAPKNPRTTSITWFCWASVSSG
jgi:hypothetical protein